MALPSHVSSRVNERFTESVGELGEVGVVDVPILAGEVEVLLVVGLPEAGAIGIGEGSEVGIGVPNSIGATGTGCTSTAPMSTVAL